MLEKSAREETTLSKNKGEMVVCLNCSARDCSSCHHFLLLRLLQRAVAVLFTCCYKIHGAITINVGCMDGLYLAELNTTACQQILPSVYIIKAVKNFKGAGCRRVKDD